MVLREALVAAGVYDEPRARALAALESGNDATGGGLRIVSRYLVFRINA